MINKISEIVNEFLEGKPYFMVSLTEKDSRITILLDGYNGLEVKTCSRLSRFIQRKGEEDEEIGSYSFEVSSPGVGKNINNSPQLKGNVGRLIRTKEFDQTTRTGKMIGISSKKVFLKNEKEVMSVMRDNIDEVKVEIEI